MKKIAVFISGGGSNLQVLIDNKFIRPSVALVVSSNTAAYGLVRAQEAGIKTAAFPKAAFSSFEARDAEILKSLTREKIDYIVLAGYLGMLTPALTEQYKNKIINIHPSLLPAFGGKGFFGKAVHEAVIKSGTAQTGATVHFVNGEYDAGAIIMQKAVPVLKDDTPETLAARVLAVEHELLPLATEKLLKGEI